MCKPGQGKGKAVRKIDRTIASLFIMIYRGYLACVLPFKVTVKRGFSSIGPSVSSQAGRWTFWKSSRPVQCSWFHKCVLQVEGLQTGKKKIPDISTLQIGSRGYANTTPTPIDPEYTVIYRLPFIRALRSFSRVKIAQTAITVVALPPLAIMCNQGIITKDTFIYSVSLAVLATVLLYAMSYYLRRIIGIMAVNKKCDTLRVSHLTFWGRRHNFFVPVSEVQPLAEVGDQPGEVLKKFKTYSSDNTLYYTLKYGMIADRKKFEKVFGSPVTTM